RLVQDIDGCVVAYEANLVCFFFSSRRRHTRSYGDWSSDVCSSDLNWDPHGHRSEAWRRHRDDTEGSGSPDDRRLGDWNHAGPRFRSGCEVAAVRVEAARPDDPDPRRGYIGGCRGAGQLPTGLPRISSRSLEGLALRVSHGSQRATTKDENEPEMA